MFGGVVSRHQQAIVWGVHAVYLTNVERRQAAADRQETKPVPYSSDQTLRSFLLVLFRQQHE